LFVLFLHKNENFSFVNVKSLTAEFFRMGDKMISVASCCTKSVWSGLQVEVSWRVAIEYVLMILSYVFYVSFQAICIRVAILLICCFLCESS
jgi:hypothetical protein